MNNLKKYNLNGQGLDINHHHSTSPNPVSNLDLVVIIPCHNEPNIIPTLNSLLACDPPESGLEVYIIINASAKHPPHIHKQNETTGNDIAHWLEQHTPFFKLFLLNQNDLPPKHAGVGLARRMGMDLAYERLIEVGHPNGVIVNLDADCTVAPNYFQAIEQHFKINEKSPGCSIHYEHPLQGPLAPPYYQAIIDYELFLRYYTQGLRYANLPCAFQTIGSAMAVRAYVYKKQGGMNRRKAGEDFYFLNKIIDLGGFTELKQTTVYPSPRSSDRVPFGTGKAVNDWLNSEDESYLTYDFESFEELKAMSTLLPDFYPFDSASIESYLTHLPPHLKPILEAYEIKNKLLEIQANTSSLKHFIKRYYHWFNGFRAMKCIHDLRDQAYPKKPLIEEAQKLLKALGQPNQAASPQALLEAFRIRDKS